MRTDLFDQPMQGQPLRPEVTTMKAIVQDSYGEADEILRFEEADRPEIETTRCWCECMPPAWTRALGTSWPACRIRSAPQASALRKPKYLNPGRSLAGTVEAAGKDVTGVRPATSLFGIGAGSFAEYAPHALTSSHPCRRISRSNKRQPSRSPRSPRSRRSATADTSSPDSRS